MNLSLLNVSCSGTTTGDLLTSENVNGVDQSPQLDQAFAHGTPKFISMTSGANDIEWSFFLKQCYTSNCADTTNTVAVDGLLVALQAKLLAALGSIQARSHGTPPRTVVTGYYQPVSAQCVQMSNGQITSAEVNWIQAATNALNQTIRQTAGQFSFVRYAPVSFAGHDACSSNPWVQMINDPAPFHPTAQGQQAIAKDVEAAMNQ
jgi:lysophospholipase L1-like esterase